MLKLRKNKKGFTLVELIVVIAIMAVLAGTVAGVTVSQLNKQTDKTNETQAKGIADYIAGEIMNSSDIYGTNGKFDATKIKSLIKGQYDSVKFTMGTGEGATIADAPEKGEFAVKVEDSSIEILYKQKQSGNSVVGWKVSDTGVVTKK